MRLKKPKDKLRTFIFSVMVAILIMNPIYFYIVSDPYRFYTDDEVFIHDDNFSYNIIATRTTNEYSFQKTQLNTGVFDAASNTTFVVYSSGINWHQSANSPYIIYFNHTTQTWSPEKEIIKSPVKPDSHNYPTLLIDAEGYLHVFHSFHGNHEILHAKSINPRDINDWEISYIEGTEKATYGAAYQASNGDFYILARITHEHEHEPEYVIKSTDQGQTWTINCIIDPAPVIDYWGTIYTKGIKYESNPEGLHITFGVHQYHNLYMNKHYHVFYSFQDNHLYGVNGQDYGTTLEGSELGGNLLFFDLGGTTVFYNVRIGLDLHEDGRPHIFWREKDTPMGEIMRWASWNGTAWSEFGGQEMEYVNPFSANYTGNDIFALTVIKGSRRVYHIEYNTSSNEILNQSLILQTINTKGRRFSHVLFIEQACPEILGLIIDGPNTPWENPIPVGKMITYGIKH